MKNQKLCSGFGQYHTDKRGLTYETITLEKIIAVIEAPTSVAKETAQWFIPSNLLTREATKQRENGEYYAVWCDIDKHTELDAIKAVLANLLCEYAIYSSRSATIEHQKWRVIIPFNEPATATQWQQVSAIINDKLEAVGIEPDRASERVNQLCYLPNRGEFYEFHIENNHAPLNWFESFKTELLEKENQAIVEKQRIDQQYEQSRLKAVARMASGGKSPITAYNAAYPVEQSLEFYGYKRVGNKWISPNSESGNAGVIVKNGRWISSHTSDAGIGKETKSGGTSGDAFDLFCYYEYGNVKNRALKAAGDMFTTNDGVTLTKANQRAYMEQNAPVSDSPILYAPTNDFSQPVALDDATDWEAKLLEVVEKFNERHAVVLLETKTMVMTTTKNKEGRDEFKYITTENFIKLHMNQFIKVGVTDKGKDIVKNHPTAWLEHWNRREFKDGVVFEPSHYANGIETPATIYGNKLNLWRGYSVEPKQGDWQRIDTHIKDVICNCDVECVEYLYNWIARCLQYPEKTGQVAVALKGEKGSGKGTVCNFINSIFGQHGLQITNAKHLVGHFNAHLADCCFLFADEAFFAGDRQHENILKTLITEPTVMIERKGIDATSQPNRLKIMMASNNDWIAPASKDERRYFVLDVLSEKIGNTDYFNALHRDINNPDIQAAFLFDMLRRDISKFNVSKVPDTTALKHQREQSLDSFGKYWIDVLQRGYIYQSQHGLDALHEWIDEPSVELIKRGYVQWCNTNKIDQHRIVSSKKYGSYLTAWYGDKKRKLNVNGVLRGETIKGEPDISKGQTYFYAVGSQSEAINLFCEVEKLDAEKLLI
jgi:hypothetical protein